MKTILISILTLLLIPALYGQQVKKATAKTRFSSINQVGLLTGAAGEAATLQTINGVRTGKWFTGVGVGINYYGMRSIPLFVDVRKTFGAKENSPFAFADGGINFPWETQTQLNRKGYDPSKNKGAFYDLGIGYSLASKANRGFLLSVGYSYKKMTSKAPLYTIMSWPGTPMYETYTNHFRTIVVKVGVQL